MGGRNQQMSLKLDDDEAKRVEEYRAWMEEQTRGTASSAAAIRALMSRGYEAWVVEKKKARRMS